MRNQVVYTKDNIRVDIDTTLFYRIVDAYKATYIVYDILESVSQMTYVTMRTICG
jgi:regulator of protease activity HflC (stomatin/prohibitin superfamily)